MSENADLRIGKNQPADQVVLEIAFDRGAEWLLGQAAPRFSSLLGLIEPSPKIFPGHERLEHRVPDLIGEDPGQLVKPLHPGELSVTTSQFEERLSAKFHRDITQEQPAVATVSFVGGV